MDDQIVVLQARVAELEAQLFRAHRLSTLGTLAASIAHEVNNLLTPILSYAQLALASPQDTELTKKALTRAADCAEKASRIGSAMLGFARADEIHVEGERAAGSGGGAGTGLAGPPGGSDVATVVDDAIACLGRDPRKDGIALQVDVPPGVRVGMSAVALQQVFLNLLLNARAAMRARPNARISIVATPCALTGNVTIKVTDTGPGMPEDVLQRLFEPFVRGGRGSSEDVASDCNNTQEGAATGSSSAGGDRVRVGNGLGLAVTHDLVRRAGGTIAVESVPGQGTTFTISLRGPAAASWLPMDSADARRAGTAKGGERSGEGGRGSGDLRSAA